MKLRNKKGFTIIELVIVIAVIGVLTAVLVPVFINLTNNAKQASDDALVTNLNKQLAIAEQQPGYKTTTYQQVIDIVDDAGYKIPNLVSKSGEDLFWNQESNRFCLGSKKDNAYPDYTYWTIKDSLDGNETYSVYAGLNFTATSALNLKAGFDVGSNAHIKDVSYAGNGAKQDGVTFRFLNDEFNTDFENNNNYQDEVKVYGNPNNVNSEKSGQQSLYIYEDIASLEVKEGHVVVAPGVKIGSLIFKATSTNNFDKIVVEIPDVNSQVENIYRSGVSTNLDAGVKVEVATIKTAQKSETYFLAGNGTIGETTDTSYLLVSTTGNVEQAVPVTEANASDAAKAIANAKDPDTGDVIDTGKTEQEIKDAVDEAQNAKQEEVVEKKAEEAGEDYSKYQVRIGTKGYDSFNAAYTAANPGDTISIIAEEIDLTTATYKNNRLYLYKSLTIDGCGNTIKIANRGFGLAAPAFTFKNVTIKNRSSGARCIDVRTNDVSGVFVEEVTLDKVTLTTQGASGTTQPLTIGGNSTNYIDPTTGNRRHTKINILNNTSISTQDNAGAYYSIISFNPIDLVIKNSSLKGWANIYLKGADSSYGSRGSNIELIDSEFECTNMYFGTSNAFGLFVFEDAESVNNQKEEGYSITLKGCDVKINASSDQRQFLALASRNTKANISFLEGNTIHFVGNYSNKAVLFGRGTSATILPIEIDIVNGNRIEAPSLSTTNFVTILDPETQELHDDGNNFYTVVAK